MYTGNFSESVQIITVQDVTKPTITTVADVIVNCQDDNSSTATGVATGQDICSPVTITQSDVSTKGTEGSPAFYNYTITRTWRATDVTGNFTESVQVITVQDVTKPIITTVADITVNCQDDNSSTATGTATGKDICSPVSITQSDVSTQGIEGSPAFYNYTITRTWRATDVTGNFSESVQIITVQDVTKPTITTVADITVNCQDDNSSTATGTATGKDICSPVTITQSDVNMRGANPTMPSYYNYSITRTWRATDITGNFSESVQTIKVQDVTKPTIVCPSNSTYTKLTNPGYCYYRAIGSEFNATATDNCALSSLNYELTGATVGTSTSLTDVNFYKGTTIVTWTAKDATRNTTVCSFTVTVFDDQNPTNYIICAKSEVKMGEYNYINGDIGITAADGKASFKKYDVMGKYFVKAKNITVDMPSDVNNRFTVAATNMPTPLFLNYDGDISKLNNQTVDNDTEMSGNYKDLNIKKGTRVTLGGNNFGKITIEEGAQVIFTSSVINMEELDVKDGKKGVTTTKVYFSKPTYIKVKEKVKIGSDCRINVGGPKLTFYVSDNKGESEKFTVNGENTQVTANIMIPTGRLKVNGGGERMTTMTGWYMVDKLESTGKYITWNAYDCAMPIPAFTKVNGKIISTITAYAEYERNAIPFVSNQGAETESWIAEKRNNVTGEFEKLDVRKTEEPSKEALQYHTFYDVTPAEGDNFYRVKLTYRNGNVAYTDVKKVNNPKTDDFTVYPNPANEEAWIDLKSFEGRQVTLVLSDMAGKTLHQQVIEKASSAPVQLDINHLQTGMYLVKIQAQGKRVMMRKIQIAR